MRRINHETHLAAQMSFSTSCYIRLRWVYYLFILRGCQIDSFGTLYGAREPNWPLRTPSNGHLSTPLPTLLNWIRIWKIVEPMHLISKLIFIIFSHFSSGFLRFSSEFKIGQFSHRPQERCTKPLVWMHLNTISNWFKILKIIL